MENFNLFSDAFFDPQDVRNKSLEIDVSVFDTVILQAVEARRRHETESAAMAKKKKPNQSHKKAKVHQNREERLSQPSVNLDCGVTEIADKPAPTKAQDQSHLVPKVTSKALEKFPTHLLENGGFVTKKEYIAIQKKRDRDGTWVQCDTCKKFRYLRSALDPSLFINISWTCSQNPDPDLRSCDLPEKQASKISEVVECQYTTGSMVWAFQPNFQMWWPGIVEDCPYFGKYFWDECTEQGPETYVKWYHVLFFSASDDQLVLDWIHVDQVKPYSCRGRQKAKSSMLKSTGPHAAAFTASCALAEVAERLTLKQRRQTFGFLSRYRGRWGMLDTFKPSAGPKKPPIKSCGASTSSEGLAKTGSGPQPTLHKQSDSGLNSIAPKTSKKNNKTTPMSAVSASQN